MHLPDGTRCLEVIADIATCGLTFTELYALVDENRRHNPSADIYLDWYRYQVVSLEGEL